MMRERHCTHCYDAGFTAGLEKAKLENADGPQVMWITLTDELRMLYGIPDEPKVALVLADGDRILTLLQVADEVGDL